MKTKKLAIALLAAMIIGSAVPAVSADTAYAETGHDTQATAIELPMNNTFEGKLESINDVTFYTTTFHADGVLQYELKKTDVSQKGSWTMTIYDQNNKEILKYVKIEDSCVTDKIAYKEGSTFTVKISSYSGAKDVNYTLGANFEIVPNWEAEENDTMATAETMDVNTVYSGTMLSINDKDYWKVTTTKNGYVTFTLSAQDVAEIGTGSWNLNIYDKDGTQLKRDVKVNSDHTTAKLAYPAGTTLYAMVENYGGSKGATYNLTCNQKASSVYETENNNTRATADTISLNKTYYGTVMSLKDEDYFKVKADAKGRLAVSLKADPNNTSADAAWTILLLDENGTEVKNTKTVKIKGKGGFDVPVAAGTYYIKVYNYSGSVDETYQLTANLVKTIASKNLTVPAIKTSSMTLNWKTLSNVSGYQIRYSRNSDMSKAVKVKMSGASTSSKTIKELKSGTKYYVQIRAYKNTASGKTVYGAWSTKKAVTTK